ncbi:MAG: DUF4918 family protein [Saprospiraceae bacterium]|nr:DUF4918 family protein [Saprospiraceae bacterium]
MYEWIDAMGGATTFYQKYLIHSVCPLGFTKGTVNYNYYDDKILEALALPLIKNTLPHCCIWVFARKWCFA